MTTFSPEESKNRATISAVIPTLNEEKNIEACLNSLSSLCDEIFIVDSGSSDETLQIARKFGAQIVNHPYANAAKQWNWALNNLPLSGKWILCLDADQQLSSELQEEIRRTLKSPPTGVDGFYLCRRQIFRGRWIRHGGYYPKYLLKLFRAGKGISDENEFQDFRFYVPGKTEKLRYDLIEDNQKEWDINFWISKHTRFAELQAREEMMRRINGATWKIKPSLFGTPDQRVLWAKNFWYHLPLYVRPFLYFFYRYFIKLGFLDGKEGFVFHFFQGFWYRLLVDVKLDELRKNP